MKTAKLLPAFVIIGTAGTLWHFVYEWSGKNKIAAAFFPVNESTWEHLKLLFFPALIYFIIEYFILKDKSENYISASAIGLIAGLLSIITIFYTYSGILGFNISAVDIAIFFISLALTLYIRKVIIKKQAFCSRAACFISIFLILLLGLLFVIWSFNPPAIGLFAPPSV